jgi:hypothetical protein
MLPVKQSPRQKQHSKGWQQQLTVEDANPAGEDAKVAEVEELVDAVNYFNNIILNTT